MEYKIDWLISTHQRKLICLIRPDKSWSLFGYDIIEGEHYIWLPTQYFYCEFWYSLGFVL